jgi:alkylhydroperoxidase family enzyme
MPGADHKRAMHQALVDGVLNGAGRTSPELRAGAFRNADLPATLHALVEKVVTRPAEITDADFDAAKAAGFGEDQLFELVTCAAVGRSARLYDAGLAALAEASGEAG